MTDTSTPVANITPSGNSKTISAFLAAGVGSYAMTYFSLHGVNFEELGVPSEIVKSALIGSLVAFFAWITPSNVVHAIRDGIVFIRDAWNSWREAAQDGNPDGKDSK